MKGTRVVVLSFMKNTDDILEAVLMSFIFNEKQWDIKKTFLSVYQTCKTHKNQNDIFIYGSNIHFYWMWDSIKHHKSFAKKH